MRMCGASLRASLKDIQKYSDRNGAHSNANITYMPDTFTVAI